MNQMSDQFSFFPWSSKYMCVYLCRNDELNTWLKFDVEHLSRQIERRTSQTDAEGQAQVHIDRLAECPHCGHSARLMTPI